MVLDRKGVEIQFNWIFVMLAGVLILGFFITMAMKQKNLSQEKLQATLSSDVDSVLVGAIVSKGVAQSLPAVPQGLNIDCTQACDCRISIGSASRPFENKPIFSPKLLEGRASLVWSLDWKLPYRITNFLFLTNPNIKYYFVYDPTNAASNALFSDITKNFPPPILRNKQITTEINYEGIPVSDFSKIVAGDESHTKFVFLNVDAGSSYPVSFNKKSASALSILQPYSILKFYNKDGTVLQPESQQTFAGLPTIYAAIFAEDSNMYKCGLKTALTRLSFVSDIYMKRAEQLNINAQMQDSSCNYLSISGLLETQKNIADEMSGTGLDQSKMNQLLGLQNSLSHENRQLVEQSCPELF